MKKTTVSLPRFEVPVTVSAAGKERTKPVKKPDPHAVGFSDPSVHVQGPAIDLDLAAARNLVQQFTKLFPKVRTEAELLEAINGLAGAATRGEPGIEGVTIRPQAGELAPEVRSALRELQGPLADMLYATSISEVLSQVQQQREYGWQIRSFKCELEEATQQGIAEVADVADRWASKRLPARFRNQLIKAMTDKATKGDAKPWEAAKDFWERSAESFPQYHDESIGREHYVVCHNKAAEAYFFAANEHKKRANALKASPGEAAAVQAATVEARASSERGFALLAKGIEEAKAYIGELTQGSDVDGATLAITPKSIREASQINGEVLAGIGKAFFLIHQAAKEGPLSPPLRKLLEDELHSLGQPIPNDLDEARAALETSHRYYLSGYSADFEYYPGINAIYRAKSLGRTEEADNLAKMVALSCKQAGGRESDDYWCLCTQVELALINRDYHELAEILPLMLAQADEGWKLDTTLGNLRSVLLAERQGKEDTTILEKVSTLMQTRIDWLALPEKLEQLTKDLALSAAQPGRDGAVKVMDAANAAAQVVQTLGKEAVLPPELAQKLRAKLLEIAREGPKPGLDQQVASLLKEVRQSFADPEKKRTWNSQQTIDLAALGAVPAGSLELEDLKLAQAFREDLMGVKKPSQPGDASVFVQLKGLYFKWKDILPQAKEVLITRGLFSVSDNLQALSVGSAIPGNVQFNGLVADTTYTRKSGNLLMEIMEACGIADLRDRRQMYDGMHRLVEDLYGLVDPKTGQRIYEDMDGIAHHDLEARERNKLEVAQIQASGENKTDISNGWWLRNGDCRPTNQTLGMGCAKHRQRIFNSIMRQAFDAFEEGNKEEANGHLGEAREWTRKQVRLMNGVYSAPIRMVHKYKWEKGKHGLPIRCRDKMGRDQLQVVEDHHYGIETTLKDNDLIDLSTKLLVLDAFYNNLYPNKYAELDPNQLFDEHGMFGGYMGITDDARRKLPFFVLPTRFSGQEFKSDGAVADEILMSGVVVEGLTADAILHRPQRVVALAQALAQLTVAQGTRAALESVLTDRETFEAGTGDIHNQWMSSMARLAADPTSPFLGFSEQRLSAGELKGLSEEELALRLGHKLSDDKLASLRNASDDEVVTDPLFRPSKQLSPELASQSALRLLGVVLYLTDARRGEHLPQVLEGLQSGSDQRGLSDLAAILQIGEAAALTSLGSRGVESEQPVLVRRKSKQPQKIAAYGSRRHLGDKVGRQDIGISVAALSWLRDRLVVSSSPRSVVEAVARGEDLDPFAHVTHGAWKAGKDADLANQRSPFLGKGASRVQVSQATQAIAARGKEALSSFLGIPAEHISDAKLEAILRAPTESGLDILHPQYDSFDRVKAEEKDGGVELVGRNVVPLMVAARYLLSQRGDELDNPERAKSLCDGLISGKDAAGVDQLADLQHLCYQQSLFAHELRPWDRDVPELIATGFMQRTSADASLKVSHSEILRRRAEASAMAAANWLCNLLRQQDGHSAKH